ncbi:MAG TPA: enolase C-terminal domain-like protein [Chloroflexota bacterium]|nr:enolase C-terminal domain-like protein [Chloroflexota bacterium]
MTRIEYFLVHQHMQPGTINGPEAEYRETRWDEVPKYLLRLHTSEGLVGIGEASRGTPEEALVGAARPLLGQDLLEVELEHLPIPAGSAYQALEMAVFDAVGKAQGKRVVDLLGGAVRDRVEVDWWSGRRSPADLARWAAQGRKRGFHGMKIKCKLGDPMVERMVAVKEAVPDMPVTVDPNCRFERLEATLDLAQALGAVGNVAVFEDPIPKQDFDAYARLRREMRGTGIPLALHLGSVGDARRAIEGGCVDVLNASPRGMVQFLEMARLAKDASIPVWHGSGNDCGPMDLSYVHACAAAPACTLPSDIMGNVLHVDHFLKEPIRFDGGWAVLPDGPGLGGELDMEAVERQLISCGEVAP